MTHDGHDPEDRFGHLDDSLDESGTELREAGAAPWLAQQRFVHGMLRALNSQDASAREARVRALMARLQPANGWRGRLAAAAAVLVLAAAAVWVLSTIDRLPRAEAMVAQALASLHEPIDRAFELQLDVERGERQQHRTMQVVLHPGSRFLITGDTTFGAFRAGCDGEEVWFEPQLAIFRSALPLKEAHRLTDRLGDVLDLGYLDLDTLLRRLPADTELRCVGREDGGIRVEAIGTVHLRRFDLRSVRMLVDDRSGLLRDVEAVAVGERRGARVEVKLRFRHVSDRSLGESAYRRPW
ncbi:MAG: hypothetical protein R3F56_09630 [Planctomycetota bacterium]